MKSKILFQPWLLILIFGIVLYFLTEQALIITDNRNYFPTLIFLGSFLIPVTLVTYFYEHVRHREISIPLLTVCFVGGGVLGSIAAGVLEVSTSSDIGGLVGVSIIEEAAKLIFPLAMYFGWRYRHEADGLLFGVAAGMGFAALETMGYALVTLLDTQGNPQSLQQLLLTCGLLSPVTLAQGDLQSFQQLLLARGLLSPAGHAAWTGLFCAVLWREREKEGHAVINWTILGAFLLAVILHTLWNTITTLSTTTATETILVVGGNLAVIITSLTLLLRRYFEAKRGLNTKGINSTA